MIRLTVIWLALFLGVPAAAQWKWVHPQPFGGFIYTMKSPDPRHMWMAGTGGTIVCTRDAGRNWETIPLDSNRMILSLSFPDSVHGWASAQGGFIFRTDDCGRSWGRIKLPNADPRDVCFTDSLNGWVGDYWTHKLYRTSNGGVSWDSVHTGISSGAIRISFADRLHGWVGGGTNKLAHTANGGLTWTPQALPFSLNYPMCFPDTSSGFALGDRLWRSVDAGNSWQSSTMQYFDPRNFDFPDKNNGWLVGIESGNTWQEGRVIRTTDGGRTYHNLFPVPQIQMMTAVTASDSMHAWVAGDGGMVFSTTDGGVNWDPRGLSMGVPWMINDMFALKDEHCAWAVGYGGFIIRTKDDGRSWEKQSCGSDLNLTAVHFFDANRGLMVGEASRIYCTSNGGEDWNRVNTKVLGNFTDMCFSTPTHGWLTAKQAIIETKDGGVTWDTCFRPTDSNELVSISFSDSLHGWALGYVSVNKYYAQIIRTSDGGRTWTVNNPDVFFNLNSICFPDSLHGWICGNSDALYGTNDGGISWKQYFIQRYSDLYSVHFTDSLNGWVVGDGSLWPYFGGIAAHTIDGGKTWARQDIGMGTAMHTVFFSDPGFGYSAGEYGAVLRWGENTLGIDDSSKDGAEHSKLHIFPNPAGDQITVEFKLESESGVSLEIWSSLGIQVSALELGQLSQGIHQENFDLCSYQPGIYILILKSKDRTQTGKIIRKN